MKSSSSSVVTTNNQNNNNNHAGREGVVAEEQNNFDINEAAILQATNIPTSNVESIKVGQSIDVRVGNTVIYHGDVTIQQFTVNRDQNSTEDVFRTNKGSLQNLVDVRKNTLMKGIFVAAAILFVLMIVIVAYKLSKADDDPDVVLELVNRTEWHGKTPDYSNTLPLELPNTRVIISHTASEPCFNLETCSLRMREIQHQHMVTVHQWGDIGYNFLVGSDARIYVGRGWKMEGAHTYRFNKRSIGLAFIGDFTSELPPIKALKAAKLLLEEGLKEKFLSGNYKLLGQRQLQSTKSPGEALYDEIKTWSHWTPNVHGD